VVPWQQINLNNYEHNHGLERWIDDEGHSVRDEQCFYARSESRPDETPYKPLSPETWNTPSPKLTTSL